MHFVYGSLYIHAEAEVEFTEHRETLRDDAERVIGWIVRWNLLGHIQAEGPAAISVVQAALRTAYCNPQGVAYAGLFHNGGATDHIWFSQDTISGIKVVAPPGYPHGSRIEFVNDRTYLISLEAEFINPYARSLIAYTESVTQQGGGGQRVVALETRYDYPVLQRTSRYSPIRIVQSGAATGRFAYPGFPDPIFPDYLNDPDTVKVRIAPRLRGNSYERFDIQWSYVMNVAQLPGPVDPAKWPQNI